MDVRYTINERIDMIYIYGEAHKNARAACNMYGERYPERRQPSVRNFQRLANLFSESGSVTPRKYNRRTTATGENSEVAVLAAVAANPPVSSRQLERDSGISQRMFFEYLSVINSIHIISVYIKPFMGMIFRSVLNFANGL